MLFRSNYITPISLRGILVDLVADLKSAGPNRPFPYPGEPSVTLTCFVDASDMAYVHEPIYTSTVSTSDTIHTHLKNI